MEPDRITQLEQDLVRLNEAGRHVAMGGLETIKAVERNTQAIAINAETMASFERTIANMQAQIDKLTKEASDG